jgi:ribosomal protein L37AE/L43A
MNKKSAFIVDRRSRKKNGKKSGKQQYKCHACGRQFTGGAFQVLDCGRNTALKNRLIANLALCIR